MFRSMICAGLAALGVTATAVPALAQNDPLAGDAPLILTDAIRPEVGADKLAQCGMLMAWAFNLPEMATDSFGMHPQQVAYSFGCSVVPEGSDPSMVQLSNR